MGVECLFSVSGKLLRAKRTRLTSGNVWVVLLLRSRFKDLGYTKNLNLIISCNFEVLWDGPLENFVDPGFRCGLAIVSTYL